MNPLLYTLAVKKSESSSVLHWAAEYGRVGTATKLLEAGADPNASTWRAPQPPLHLAAKYGQDTIIELLLEHGANINAQSYDHWLRLPFPRGLWDSTDAFHIAAAEGCLEFMQFLFQEGYEADINRQDPSGYSPLHYAFEGARRHQTLQWLLARGADINAEFNRGATLLHVTCYDAHFEDAGFLLDAGASHWIHILKLFKKAGRDFSTEDQAIAQAVLLKKEGKYLHRELLNPLPTVNWLLAHGTPAVLNSESILAALVDYFHLRTQQTWPCEVFRRLLDHGLDPNATYERQSLFWQSYKGRNLHLSQLLIAYGAHQDQLHDLFDELIDGLESDPLRDIWGYNDDHKWNQLADDFLYLLDCDISQALLRSPESLLKALKIQSIQLARILLDVGSPNASGVTDAGQTCLHFLASSPLADSKDYLYVTKRLLELGADPRIGRGLPGMSPMWLALGNQRWAFARLLVDYGAHATRLESSGLKRDHPHHHHQSFLWGLRNAPPPFTLGTRIFIELLNCWYLVTRDEKSSFTQGVTRETALFYTYSQMRDPYSGIKWLLNPEVDINWAPDRGPTALTNLAVWLSATDKYLEDRIRNVMILLEHGADPLRKDGRGISAMDIIKLDLEKCAMFQGTKVPLLEAMTLEHDADNRLYKLKFRPSLGGSWETRSYAEEQD
ncbi:hypothetical protein DL764_003207 [Monosporascus ibericus]|uniref:Uncharacterized protein n=1 Tax=Monosporascus ibericus TaxID=155417 RepID=A0A4Q4TJ64_9PEZI|nr:hypothetical protein DL764_003207 [Monosporascus ibericus]